MAITPTTNLSLPLITTGTESGIWGDDVNNGLTQYLDISIAGTLALTSSSFTANALTLANTAGTNTTTNIGATTAQYYVLKVSSLTANVTITAPSTSKTYVLVNLDSTYSVTIKASGQSGIAIPAGQRALVVYNGTDYVQVGASAGGSNTQVQYNSSGALAGSANFTFNGTTATVNTLNLTNALGPTYGGTNQSSYTTGDTLYASASNTLSKLAIGSTNQVLTVVGGVPAWANASTGTVTSVSVASANGFAGTSSGGATPALTLSTSISGVLKGNGTALSAATAGTDYVAPGTATTFTASQTFSGSTSVFGAITANIAETTNITAGAINSTPTAYFNTGAVQVYTTATGANWTQNLAFSSGTTMNSALAIGQSATIAILALQGSTAYYMNGTLTIDGTSTGVTTYWQGGTAPTKGNASGYDVYTYTIIKTASATYTVLATLTQF